MCGGEAWSSRSPNLYSCTGTSAAVTSGFKQTYIKIFNNQRLLLRWTCGTAVAIIVITASRERLGSRYTRTLQAPELCRCCGKISRVTRLLIKARRDVNNPSVMKMKDRWQTGHWLLDTDGSKYGNDLQADVV